MYSIIDIETTGGYAADHKIIEVAVVIHDGEQEVERFETLINPGRPIPLHITALTGISDEMVASAPAFPEVADKIHELTKDNVFVAHQVNFDYSFLRKEMQEAGISFQRKKLCTVRTSRKLIPDLPSYSLGRLCGALELAFDDRHRAMGDAQATVLLLKHLFSVDDTDEIGKALKRTSREALLPPNLPKEQFEALPEKPGVYYFKDSKGKIIYVGKAKKIKTRVTSHFSGTASSFQKQHFMQLIHQVDFALTGNELTALLLESSEIKKYWPRFNKSQKSQGSRLGMVTYTDQKGFLRLGIHPIKKHQKSLVKFSTVVEGRSFLWSLVAQFSLCARLVGLQSSTGPCMEVESGQCDGACVGDVGPEEYNDRVLEAMDSLQEGEPSFAIIGKGRKNGERTIVLMENGVYLGFGFSHKSEVIPEMEALKKRITSYSDNNETRGIIYGHLRRAHRDQVWELQEMTV